MRRLVLVLTALALCASACGDDDDAEGGDGSLAPATSVAPTTSASTTTGDDGAPAAGVLRVPDDFATIQEAVDAASPGDLVLIGPGTYHENVVVETEDLTIRGLDRNEVVLDGQDELENGIIVFANGVAVENLTVTAYNSNGVFFTGDYGSDFVLTGYRASYVTAYNNGLYGIYAFNAASGLIEHSYASGHPDSGFYIGQCQPCDAVITDVVSENNALGYSGTNAGGNLFIVNSEWRNNRIGIVPNSLDSEELAPQRSATIAGNHVHDNGNADTPRKSESWDAAFGGGIVLAGGSDNTVIRNRVADNPNVGIAAALFADENVWVAEGNRIEGNVVSGSRFDLGLLVPDPAAGPLGNCFTGNDFATSMPEDIEAAAPCDGEAGPLSGVVGPNTEPMPAVDHRAMAAPPPQEDMPDAATAPARPAVDVPPTIDVDTITVPTG